MKTTIYYFTGTGNSLKVAKDLAYELGSTELIPMAKAVNNDTIEISGDLISFIFPVYCWGLPLLVCEFMKKIKPDAHAYYFAVTTFGAFPGKTLLQLNTMLKEKGISLSAGFGIKMPGNYTPLYGAVSPDIQSRLFAHEQTKIKNIASIIKDKKKIKIETSNLLANVFFSDLLYKPFISKMAAADKKFWADEKCNSCNICALICPVTNISMENGKPRWHQNCQQCMACLQWCPQEAIQYGKATIKRKRYHHPEITQKEIAGQKAM